MNTDRKIGRWTREEDELLRAHYATHTRQQIADLLGRNKSSVRSRCWALGLNTKSSPRWLDSDEQTLCEQYAFRAGRLLRLSEIAELLGRSEDSICQKAAELGLTDTRRPHVEQRKARRKYATNEEYLKARSEMSRRRIAERGHPRGALGMKHTEQSKRVIAEKSRARWQLMTPEKLQTRREKRLATCLEKYGAARAPVPTENSYSRCRRGRREDLGGLYVRSAWEANYCRYLNLLVERGEIQHWEYEPQTFRFDGVTRGAHSYTPDFLVVTADDQLEYHEVKGWMRSEDRTRLKRMDKFYPDVTIRLIGEKEYRQLERTFARLIPEWEHRLSRP